MFYAKRMEGDIRGTFFEKCYICEQSIVTGGQNEHRIPKCASKSDKNLLQESNIFWACSRCNIKKHDGYWEPSNECRYSYGFIGIIDCTKCDPNKYIKMKIEIGDFSKIFKIALSKKADAPCINNTLGLLKEVYGIEMGMDDIDVENLNYQIFIEVNNFNKILGELLHSIRCNKSSEEIKCCKEDVIKFVLPNSPFSAFKRTCVEEAYEITSEITFKKVLEEILNDSRLNPIGENLSCSVIK